ncbi:MAG TPA: DotH/IcmK family type IV secretion protein [Gammaproteobacteria bacterium]|nr:DotH/IcmK family type IV secretion protein [Gammaproteobacteria bacterium]
MHSGKHMLVLALLVAGTSPASADIYDVLRGTQSSSNLTYNDVQKASPAATAAQAQAQAQAQGSDSGAQPAFKPTTLRDEAFKELLNKTFPLLPKQIEDMHKHFDDEQLAIRTPAYAPPQPVSSTLTVDLSPGATPPVIRLATGFVTSIVFVDSTGKSWPVADYSLGNPSTFNIKWDNKTNTLFIQSLKDHASGNMAVRLGDLETPIMISIVTGQKEVDYRVDFQVPKTGPNAEAAVLDVSMPNSASATLMTALDGVPPSGSIELNVAKEYGRAWAYNGKLLFRTKLTILSPAWSAMISSPDGTRVYELVQTPLILASQNGKTIKIELSGL